MNQAETKPIDSIARRQWAAAAIYLTVLAVLLSLLYLRDRQQEWQLRQEQSRHRLELAYELISRDLQRVRSDLLFLANQSAIRQFQAVPAQGRDRAETEFVNFLTRKIGYQQVRLLSLEGEELLRVERGSQAVQVTPNDQLQDKRERYYFQESRSLNEGEIFVSDFDLNQEFGQIEEPLKPVIRFVSPVVDSTGNRRALLVLNYLGSPLLNELRSISLPGQTWLVRDDGEYLLAAQPDLAWGWLLGHEQRFSDAFPDAWQSRSKDQCFLTQGDAFAFREIQLQRLGEAREGLVPDANSLFIVSYFPREQVFEKSKLLLGRLSLLGILLLLPVTLLVRLWAQAAYRRRQQNRLLAESEAKLRELSSRLIKIQEDERRAISREIHDQLGQQATAINLDMKLAARSAPPALKPQLQRAIDESQQLLETLHDFASRVRPVELDDLGLRDAVESHLESFSARTGIETRFSFEVSAEEVPTVVAENVYRLIQEALNNVVKHADASSVVVDVQEVAWEGHQNCLKLSVSDDGIGVDAARDSELEHSVTPVPGSPSHSRTSGLGLLGMRERVDLLDGTISVSSPDSGGTLVEARLPLPSPTADPVSPPKSIS